MYCYYARNINATDADLMNDITALLTGETDKANLSAACDQANTSLFTSIIAGGWTEHDANAGSNAKVFSAPYIGGMTGEKYLHIELTGSGSNSYLRCTGYSEWDAVAHTGTHPTTYIQTRYNSSATGAFVFASSARFAWFSSNYSVTWDTTQILVTEYEKLLPWHTNTAGYPAFAVCDSYVLGGNESAYFPRIRDRTGVELTGINAKSFAFPIGASPNDWGNSTYFPTGSSAKVINANGDMQAYFAPIYFGKAPTYAAPIGQCSKDMANIWVPPNDLYADFETINTDGGTFVAVPAGIAARFLAIPKG